MKESWSNPYPIFIGGYMHSGTTLLKKVLGKHPDIYDLKGESKIFESIPVYKKKFNKLKDEQVKKAFWDALLKKNIRRKFKNENGEKHILYDEKVFNDSWNAVKDEQDIVLFFDKLASFFANYHRKSFWLEKSPNNVFYLDKIFEYFPYAKFIYIVRDGRDVLASKKKRWMTIDEPGRYHASNIPYKKLEKQFNPHLDLLGWRSNLKCFENYESQTSKQIFKVYYEDLVRNPIQTIQQVEGFLNLNHEIGIGDFKAISNNASDWETMNNQKGVFSNSIGKYKNVLTEKEIRFSNHYCRYEFSKEGYEVPQKNGLTVKAGLLGFYLKGFFGFFKRFNARLKMNLSFSYLFSVFWHKLKPYLGK